MRIRSLGLPLLLLLSLSCSKREVTTPAPADSTAAAVPAATSETSTTVAPAAPTATAATPQGIATTEGEKSGVTATVTELKRTSGGLVSLKLAIANSSDDTLTVGYDFGDREQNDFATFGGLQLIDPVGKKKYFVARDSEGHCVCSRDVKDVKKGSTLSVWAKFPAPPDDVQKVSVVIPHFAPLDDVPLSR
jgi:hypothetical protein